MKGIEWEREEELDGSERIEDRCIVIEWKWILTNVNVEGYYLDM